MKQENRYFFYRNDQKNEYFPFDPKNPACLDAVGYKYFGRVLNLLDPMVEGQGLTFIVTAWTVHDLPEYGPNVVSCILQDEWGREPRYREKVKAVFKTCGRFPYTAEPYKFGGPAEIFPNLLGQTKAFLNDGTGRARSLTTRIHGKDLAPVYDIPLGYYANEPVDFIPITERSYDLFFAGSVQHRTSAPKKIKRPKELARTRMETALSKLEKSCPDCVIRSNVTADFGTSIVTDNTGYLQNMMNTKICPVPRGANLETFRFYEAIRFGAIPVGEAFPKAWFYEDAPILRLKDWSDLTTVIPDLLSDPDRLIRLHSSVMNWWQERCSEKATARFIAEQLNKNRESQHD